MDKYYIVIDMEFVTVDRMNIGKYGATDETAQIGAVMLDKDMNIISTFQTYVKPRFGHLNSAVKRLTGIKNGDLMKAPDIRKALRKMSKWLPDNAEYEFISWSDNDEKQFKHEMKFNHLEDEKLQAEWRDCQKMFGIYMNEPGRKYGLQYVLCIVDINGAKEEAHDALADAYNTALVFAELERGTLKFNSYYQRQDDEDTEEKNRETFGCSLGEMFSDVFSAAK